MLRLAPRAARARLTTSVRQPRIKIKSSCEPRFEWPSHRCRYTLTSCNFLSVLADAEPSPSSRSSWRLINRPNASSEGVRLTTQLVRKNGSPSGTTFATGRSQRREAARNCTTPTRTSVRVAASQRRGVEQDNAMPVAFLQGEDCQPVGRQRICRYLANRHGEQSRTTPQSSVDRFCGRLPQIGQGACGSARLFDARRRAFREFPTVAWSATLETDKFRFANHS